MRTPTSAGSFQPVASVDETCASAFGVALHQVQPAAEGAHPEMPAAVFMEIENTVGAQATGIGAVGCIMMEGKAVVIRGVQTEKPVFTCAQPDVAIACLQHGIYLGSKGAFLRDELPAGRQVEHRSAVLLSDAHHPALRTGPQTAFVVSQKGTDVHVLLHEVKCEEVGLEREPCQTHVQSQPQVALPVHKVALESGYVE